MLYFFCALKTRKYKSFDSFLLPKMFLLKFSVSLKCFYSSEEKLNQIIPPGLFYSQGQETGVSRVRFM